MVNIELYVKELEYLNEEEGYPSECCYMDAANYIFRLHKEKNILSVEKERLFRCRDYFADKIVKECLTRFGIIWDPYYECWIDPSAEFTHPDPEESRDI